ncbi:MAG: O-antigen ligase family protein [Acidobacteria bacterium]|nr:O-antigen ligase family protein [Acidobacteriota bacterium]
MEKTLGQRIVSGRVVPARLATVTAWLTGLSCVAVLFSIAVSQILLAGALACLLLSRRPLEFPARWRIPLLAFAGWTLLAVAFSDAPVSGLPQIRKLFIFFVLLLVVNGFQNQSQIWRTVEGVLVGGIVAALYGLGQFVADYLALQRQGVGFYENYVVHQITGFMSHWMTYAGQLMIVFLLLLAILLFATDCAGKRLRWLGMVLLSLALMGAFTRGIWLGTLAGTTFLVTRYRRWMITLIPVAIVLIYLLSPSWLQRRDESIFQPQQDSSSMARLVMLQTGLEMIRAHPVFGLGPERVGVLFRHYTPADITLPPAWYGHLHNSFLQLAAERGIPCVFFLIWFFYEVICDNVRQARNGPSRQRALGSAAIAATIGILVAGLFEYNLGDSEVLMLYLFAISVPYAWGRAASNPAPRSQGAAPPNPA